MAYCYYKPLTYHDGACVNFRLLTLEPGKKHESLCAKLWHASLDQPPPYEALSYVWGSPIVEAGDFAKVNNFKKSQVITLDAFPLPVGGNLYSALQHLRNETEPRTLWVDAICINQNDLFERGRQVCIMSQIYAKSSSVLAWLGVADEDSDIMMGAIEDMCWAVKVHLMDFCAMSLETSLVDVTDKVLEDVVYAYLNAKDHSQVFTTGPFSGLFRFEAEELLSALRMIQVHIPSDCRSLEDLGRKHLEKARFLRNALLSAKSFTEMSSTSSSSFKAIAQSTERFFKNRNYWKRLWVVQEAFFAPDLQLMCGSTILHGTRLLVIDKLRSSFKNRPKDTFPAGKMHFAKPSFVDRPTGELSASMLHFADTLLDTLECAFPSDTYRLLNRNSIEGFRQLHSNMQYFSERLCTEAVDIIFALLSISQPINVEPDYEKSSEDIFIHTTKAIMEQEQCLDVICHAANNQKLPLGGCVSCPELPSFVPNYEARLQNSFLLDPGKGERVQYYHAGGALMPEYRLRETLTLGLLDSKGKLLEDWPSVKKWYSNLRPTLGHKYNSTMIEDWRMIFGDIYMRPSFPLYYLGRMNVYEEAYQLLIRDVGMPLLGFDEPPFAFLNWLRGFMHDNSIYLTDRGDFVKAHRRVRIGDEIFVARGCSFAMVLLPVSEAQVKAAIGHLEGTEIPVREFVAGAYVHGIMNGEAIQQVNDGNVKEQEI